MVSYGKQASDSFGSGASIEPGLGFPNASHILRGCGSSQVLHQFGKILKSSEGSAKTYTLSNVVQALEEFISHNWTTPRDVKFGVLALRFNFQAACLMSICITVVLFLAASTGHWPTATVQTQRRGDVEVACLCTVWVVPVVFFPTMFIWHEVQALFGWRGRICFLDKTCIHQTDNELKEQGIKNLAAFIGASKYLTVVYTDTYLRKLWTVYELATFIMIRPPSNIAWIPVRFPRTLVQITYGAFFFFVIPRFFAGLVVLGRSASLFQIVIFCSFVPTFLWFCKTMRSWERERQDMYTITQCFDIKGAACFVEEDRAFVEASVVNLMRHSGFVPQDASDDVVLDAFNTIVREKLPIVLNKALGNSLLRYRYAVLFTLPFMGLGLDEIAIQMMRGDTAYSTIISLQYWFGTAFIVIPLLLVCWGLVIRQQLSRKGTYEWILCFCCVLVSCLLIGVVDSMKVRFAQGAAESMIIFAVSILTDVILFCCVLYAYHEPELKPIDSTDIRLVEKPSSKTMDITVWQKAADDSEATYIDFDI